MLQDDEFEVLLESLTLPPEQHQQQIYALPAAKKSLSYCVTCL